MINDKSLIKYKHDNDQGLMHYVVFEGEVVVLSKYASKKITYIEQNGKLNITFDVKSKDLELVEIELVTDKEYVEKVYNYMIEINNAYFTDGFDDLCVLKFGKK
jgi:general stress protein 26